jgi:hypothetical protein
MCNYENVTYACGHTKRSLIKYCHFARVDPDHNCFGPWSIKRERTLPFDNCEDCIAAGAPRMIKPPKMNDSDTKMEGAVAGNEGAGAH